MLSIHRNIRVDIERVLDEIVRKLNRHYFTIIQIFNKSMENLKKITTT